MDEKSRQRVIVTRLDTLVGHWYTVSCPEFPQGIVLPSPTNIMEHCFPKPGLDAWKINTSAEEIKFKQETGKASGSKAHHGAFLMNQGQRLSASGFTKAQIAMLPISGEDKLAQYLAEPFTDRELLCFEALENFNKDYEPELVEQEKLVYSLRHRYAGTLDWIGFINLGKKKGILPFLLDYKISASHDLSYCAQIAAYLTALQEMTGKAFPCQLGLLYLGKKTKKKYQLKIVDNPRKHFWAFLNSKHLWHHLYPNAQPKMRIVQQEFSCRTDFRYNKKIF